MDGASLTDAEMIRVTRQAELDEATRAALASGRAQPALGLFIDTLMTLRGISEGEGDAIAGAALEGEAPAEMHPEALAMAFAAIERGAARKPRAMAYPELADLPSGLREAIREAEGRTSWKTIGPGIRSLNLGSTGDLKAEIIRVSAGMSVPWHTHKGHELTLCVHGEYSDGLATYGPGDFSVTDGTIRHQPRAHDAGPAYAFAVTDAGLKFEGLLGALQKLIGQG
jgi:putative transcriptional regulator